MIVMLYHTRGLWVACDEKREPLWGAHSVALKDVIFEINHDDQQRARRRSLPNVHAWAKGELIGKDDDDGVLIPEDDASIQAGLFELRYHWHEDDYFKAIDPETGALFDVVAARLMYCTLHERGAASVLIVDPERRQ